MKLTFPLMTSVALILISNLAQSQEEGGGVPVNRAPTKSFEAEGWREKPIETQSKSEIPDLVEVLLDDGYRSISIEKTGRKTWTLYFSGRSETEVYRSTPDPDSDRRPVDVNPDPRVPRGVLPPEGEGP